MDNNNPDQDPELLGKAYDPRLMRRLWGVTRPHGRLVLLAMLLFPATAALELLQPWLTKIAIDRYILTGDWPGLSRIAAAYLACLLVLSVLAAGAAYFRRKARDSYRAVRTRRARLNAFLQESLQGMAVIQLFARERKEAELFAGLNGDLRRAQFRSTFFDSMLYAGVEAIGSVAVALLLWYGGEQVLAGAL